MSHLPGKMQCFFRYCVFLAIINIVVAQTAGFDEITSPTQDQILPAGSSVDIVWTSSTQYAGTITITLLQGSTSSALSVGNVIAGLTRIHPKEIWTDGPQLDYSMELGVIHGLFPVPYHYSLSMD